MVLPSGWRGGATMADLESLAMIQARRRMQIMRASGVWLVGFWTAVLTALALLGFGYDHELAQAMALLLVPLTLAAWLGMRLSARIESGLVLGENLTKTLVWHRVGIQAIGLLAIFVTTMWGMWQNLSIRVLG